MESAALFVAFSNGANDNFKGFATVWGRLASLTIASGEFGPVQA